MPAVIPILATAISAAGAGYGIYSSEQAQSKMNQDTANTVGQLQQLQKQATPIYQQNLKQATNGESSQQGEQQVLQQYQRAAQLPATTVGSAISAPPSKSVDARTSANIQRQSQANAAVQQYPAMETGWNVGNALTNAKLGNIASIGSSVASTLPSTLDSEQEAGQAGQSIGNAIGSAGGVLGAYGTSRGANASNQALLTRLQQLAQWNQTSQTGVF